MVWFQVENYPTLILVGKGHYRVFEGERTEEAFSDFIVDSERKLAKSDFGADFRPLPPPPSPLLVSVLHLQDFFSEHLILLTFLASIVGCAVGFGVVACFGEHFVDNDEEKESLAKAKKGKKKKKE